MNSALGQNDRYLRYISAIWEGPLRVTAELTEMVQYFELVDASPLFGNLTRDLDRHAGGSQQPIFVLIFIGLHVYKIDHENWIKIGYHEALMEGRPHSRVDFRGEDKLDVCPQRRS